MIQRIYKALTIVTFVALLFILITGQAFKDVKLLQTKVNKQKEHIQQLKTAVVTADQMFSESQMIKKRYLEKGQSSKNF